MSTDYTPAKDRLLVALAEWFADDTSLERSVKPAARAVLEEEKRVQGQKEYDSTLLVIIEAKDKELTELKRRVERVAKELRRCKPCDNCGMPVGQDYPGQWADILEGKERP